MGLLMNNEALTQLAAWGVVAIIIFFIVAIAVYIYMALALMTIAKKTKTPRPWLAWIPIANFYLMTQIAGVSGLVTLVLLASFIPYIGGLIIAGVSAWLWWRIAEERHRPGWWGILTIIPIVNLVIMGMLAWKKK